MSTSEKVTVMNSSEARKVEQVSSQCSRQNIKELNWRLVKKAEAKGKLLGKGTFGACYLLPGEDGLPLCVKILRMKHSLKTILGDLLEEAIQMAKVKDIPGMIHLVGVSLWPTPAIFTEYAGESLFDLLKKKKVSRFEALQIMTQVVSIMSQLTENNLSHGDLKTDNIVVRFAKEGPVVTIIDLGWMNEFGYDPGWGGASDNSIYAPELTTAGTSFSPETQVYQVGKVLLEILKRVRVGESALEKLAEKATGEASNRPTMQEIFSQVKHAFVHRSLELMYKKEKYCGKRKRARGRKEEAFAPKHKRLRR